MGRPSDEGALPFPSYARLPVAFQSAFPGYALYPGVLAALVPSAIERRRFQRLVPAAMLFASVYTPRLHNKLLPTLPNSSLLTPKLPNS